MRTKDKAAILTDVVELGDETRNPIHSTLTVGLYSLRLTSNAQVSTLGSEYDRASRYRSRTHHGLPVWISTKVLQTESDSLLMSRSIGVRVFHNCRAIRPSINVSIYRGFDLNADYHSPPLIGKYFSRRSALISQRYAAPPKGHI